MTEPPPHEQTIDDSRRDRQVIRGPALVSYAVDSGIVICDPRRPQAWIRADETVSLDERR